MAGSPKKRARRLAQAGAPRAGARAGAGETTPLVDLLRAAWGDHIAPVPPERVPSDAELLRIAKGALLALVRAGEPSIQVKAAWNLADLVRRDLKPANPHSDSLDAMSDEELAAQAAEAERALGSSVQ